jgi:hypothetical protein
MGLPSRPIGPDPLVPRHLTQAHQSKDIKLKSFVHVEMEENGFSTRVCEGWHCSSTLLCWMQFMLASLSTLI